MLSVFMSLSVATSCHDNDEINGHQQPSERIVTDVLLSWESPINKIKASNTGYRLISEGDDYLVYSSQDNYSNIIYGFTDRKLSSSYIRMANNKSVDWTRYLKQFSELGTIDSTTVFHSTHFNSLAFLETDINDISYSILGFTPIESELTPELPPVVVTTGDATNIKSLSATVGGRVSGINSEAKTGFIYGRQPTISEMEGIKIFVNSQDTFSVTLPKLFDETDYYYAAFAEENGMYYLGEVRSFKTPTLTYQLEGDDRTFKMVHFSNPGFAAFAIMQTELPPLSGIIIDGETYKMYVNTDYNVPILLERYVNDFVRELTSKTGLPFRQCTEQEWLYVASEGYSTPEYKYSGSDNLEEVGWYSSNSNNRAHPVAMKAPNKFDIYDLSGNYAELVLTNEEWIPSMKTTRANIHNKIYGGSWKSPAAECTISSYKETVDSYKKIGNSIYNEINAEAVDATTIRLAYAYEWDMRE